MLPLLLFVAAISPANPSHSDNLEDCRNQLFAQNTDIASADDACAAAIADNPDVGTARLLRAYSRLRRLAEEQTDGSDPGTFTDSVKEFQDALGLDGQDEERLVHHFTAKLPRADFGASADGSTSRCDPYLELHVEAGLYFIAIGSGSFGTSDAIDGCCSNQDPYTVIDNQIVPSDHGDIRLTLSDRRGLVNGIADHTFTSRAIHKFELYLASAQTLRVDVLSWEGGNDPWGYCTTSGTRTAIDVNDDLEIAFVDASLAVFRDDGNGTLGWEDEVIAWDNGTAGSLPVVLPDDAPDGADFQQALETVGVLDALALSVADLQAITDPNFSMVLTPDELEGIHIDDGYDDFGNGFQQPIEFDIAEVRLFESALSFLLANLAISQGSELDIHVAELTPVTPQIQIEREVLDANPDFLTRSESASTYLGAGFNWLRTSIAAYETASEAIWSDSSRDGNFVSFIDSGRGQEARFRSVMASLKRATLGQTPVLCDRTTFQRNVMNVLLERVSSSYTERGALLDLHAMIASGFAFRDLLPDLESNRLLRPYPTFLGGPEWTPFPDVNFGETLFPATATLDCDSDGVADDGDGSGTPGDAPCQTGQVTGCDDNAPSIANGPAGGTCVAPSSNVSGSSCLSAEDCESDQPCSLAQDDQNNDGLGDVFPGARGEKLSFIDEGTLFGLSDFIDEIEPGSGIAFDNGLDTNANSIAIACGACGEADFEDPVFSISSWGSFCGYSFDPLFEIAQNGDALCLQIVESGRRYDLDLHSFKNYSSGCIDADAGASCGAAGGKTSYSRRLYVPEPGLAHLLGTALLTLAWFKRRRVPQGSLD